MNFCVSCIEEIGTSGCFPWPQFSSTESTRIPGVSLWSGVMFWWVWCEVPVSSVWFCGVLWWFGGQGRGSGVWGLGSGVFWGVPNWGSQPVPNWGSWGVPNLGPKWGVQCVPNELFSKDVSRGLGRVHSVHTCAHTSWRPELASRIGAPVRPEFGVQILGFPGGCVEFFFLFCSSCGHAR